jgi:hypothetical protein
MPISMGTGMLFKSCFRCRIFVPFDKSWYEPIVRHRFFLYQRGNVNIRAEKCVPRDMRRMPSHAPQEASILRGKMGESRRQLPSEMPIWNRMAYCRADS